MRKSRGVLGDPECTVCFEADCFGCAKLSPPVGTCPICNNPVLMSDYAEWIDGRPAHWECIPEMED